MSTFSTRPPGAQSYAMTDAQLEWFIDRYSNHAQEEHQMCPCNLLEEVVRLRAENERLRGLIKQGEWNGPAIGRRSYSCPWCEAAFAPDEPMAEHIDCPTFTPSGEVK